MVSTKLMIQNDNLKAKIKQYRRIVYDLDKKLKGQQDINNELKEQLKTNNDLIPDNMEEYHKKLTLIDNKLKKQKRINDILEKKIEKLLLI